jgi:hypothetical protein
MKPANIVPIFVLCFCAVALSANAEETGRTDGSEASEYGKGGYPFGGPIGRFYISPAFGSGIFNTSGLGNRSGLLYGLDIGYERDGWIGIQGGYAYLSDRKMSIFSLGARFAYPAEPFVYHLSTQAGYYAPDTGSKHFGLAPGAGIDIVVSDRIQIGLNYTHDFIFADTGTDHLDRVYAGLKVYF